VNYVTKKSNCVLSYQEINQTFKIDYKVPYRIEGHIKRQAFILLSLKL